MKFLHLLEKLTHRIAHLSTVQIAVVFGLTVVLGVGIGVVLGSANKTSVKKIAPLVLGHVMNPPAPPQQATDSPVLNATVSSNDSKKASAGSAGFSGSVKEVGISTSESLLSLSDSALNTRLNDFKNLGITWIRADLSWNSVQHDSASSYDWTPFDRLVNASNSYGFKLLPIIAYTPFWARPSGCDSDKCAPADFNKFASFANTAVNRYKAKGIHYWEIWNEPNMRSFWEPTPNASSYASLLKVTVTTVRKADSSAFIVLGSTGSTDTAGGVPQLDFMSGVYSAGGKGYFDAVGYHPYSFPVLPTDYYDWNAWSKMFRTPVSLRTIMNAHGDTTKTVWVTEFGAPTGGPGAFSTTTNYNFGSGPDHVDEALQAAMATAALADYKVSTNIGKFFWYSYQDIGTSTSSTENFYGLRRSDGTIKPAYSSLKSAISALKN